MKFFAHRVERDFHVFDDGIAFVLSIEGFFAGPFNRMFQQVEQTADAGRLSLFDQLLASRTHEKCLHVASGLREIEQLAPVRAAAHLDDAPRLIESHVRQRPRRNIHIWRAAALGKLDHLRCEITDGSQCFLVLCSERCGF